MKTTFLKPSWRLLVYLVLILATFLWLIPIITGLVTSIRTFDDILYNGFISWPKEITLRNFAEAWDRGGLSRYLPNSFIITIPSLVFTLFLSSLGAYALSLIHISEPTRPY